MFDRNDPAMPGEQGHIPEGTWNQTWNPSLTEFEQCAKEFTVAWIPVCSQEQRNDDATAIKSAVHLGILAAEEFCRQMGREREK